MPLQITNEQLQLPWARQVSLVLCWLHPLSVAAAGEQRSRASGLNGGVRTSSRSDPKKYTYNSTGENHAAEHNEDNFCSGWTFVGYRGIDVARAVVPPPHIHAFCRADRNTSSFIGSGTAHFTVAYQVSAATISVLETSLVAGELSASVCLSLHRRPHVSEP